MTFIFWLNFDITNHYTSYKTTKKVSNMISSRKYILMGFSKSFYNISQPELKQKNVDRDC